MIDFHQSAERKASEVGTYVDDGDGYRHCATCGNWQHILHGVWVPVVEWITSDESKQARQASQSRPQPGSRSTRTSLQPVNQPTHQRRRGGLTEAV